MPDAARVLPERRWELLLPGPDCQQKIAVAQLWAFLRLEPVKQPELVKQLEPLLVALEQHY